MFVHLVASKHNAKVSILLVSHKYQSSLCRLTLRSISMSQLSIDESMHKPVRSWISKTMRDAGIYSSACRGLSNHTQAIVYRTKLYLQTWRVTSGLG